MKKLLQQHRVALFLIKALVLYLGFCTQAMAQQIVQGKVTDENNLTIIGANVIIQGTNQGVNTDIDGAFKIEAKSGSKLEFTFVGYKAKIITVGTQTTINVSMVPDDNELKEVVVTGVADARTKLQSSVSISSVSAKQLEVQAPVSAADLLKNVPGVFVNSSLGEIRNVVYSRGVSAGSVEAAGGYYYVSLQEDGLPVTNITFSNFGPDYFYRTDATFKRLEALRGGTASIFGANAPGGIFNYVSKTGKEDSKGEIRTKYGYEGNGNYYRTDLNFGGNIGKTNDWNYNIGGFYRYSEGARNVGYPMNVGGQIKANITRNLKNGFVRLYAKYLNDRNGWFEFLPVKNFDNPTFVPGIDNTTTFLPPAGNTSNVPFGSTTNLKNFDPSQLTHSKDYAAGLEFKYDLGHGLTIRNNFKYSIKDINWNSTAQAYPLGINNPNLHNLFGTRNYYGTYTFTQHGSAVPLAVMNYQPTGVGSNGRPTGDLFTVTQNNLPGQSVLQNGVVTQLGLIQLFQTHEMMDQFSITKKFNNVSITAGGFYGRTALDVEAGRSGVGLTTIENRPSLLDVTFVDLQGRTQQATDLSGWGYLGGQGPHQNHHVTQDQKAAFLGYEWQITDKFNFDASARFENVRVNGTVSAGGLNAAMAADNPNNPTYGGLDGNILTQYDNRWFANGTVRSFDKSISTFSYSTGLNYKLNNSTALYARYSLGNKAPDVGFYTGNYPTSQFNIDNLNPKAQKIEQVEIGFKSQRKNLNLFLTPFYSTLSNIYTFATLQDENLLPYLSTPLYNKLTTFGVEIEGDYTFLNYFNLRSVATIQSSKATKWGIIRSTANGTADDYVDYSYSGNKADNTPDLMLNITGTYTRDKYYTYFGWKFMGDRPANVANAFTLQSFSQFDFGLGYNLNKHISLSGNINNVFNSEGVMSWAAPGGFPLAGDRQGFVKVTDPNATFFVIPVQPRAYYLTATYRF